MRLAGFKVPVEHLSSSSLATFLTCPEQFRLEKIEGRKGRVGLSGFVGRVHHGAVETLLRQRMTEGVAEPLGVDITTAYERAWGDSMEEEEPEWELNPSDVATNGLKMIGSLVDTSFSTLKPLAVEERFEELIPGIPVPITGYIDCWEQDRIVEFKTSKQKPARERAKAKWRTQGRIYQLASRVPVDWLVTTRQATPVTYDPANGYPGLRMMPGNPDDTVRLLVQAVEQMNDLYARYGPTGPWPLLGQTHEYACDYCPAGPKHPDPTCPVWRTYDTPAAA